DERSQPFPMEQIANFPVRRGFSVVENGIFRDPDFGQCSGDTFGPCEQQADVEHPAKLLADDAEVEFDLINAVDKTQNLTAQDLQYYRCQSYWGPQRFESSSHCSLASPSTCGDDQVQSCPSGGDLDLPTNATCLTPKPSCPANDPAPTPQF